ncbi:type II CAAX endopeptidase family protein [Halorubellus sp. PRR65]|uniref:type II CAAX endopeptidase family protein n=1 Tax=Halorubellus sp. PRR65 TaxID=3098148 RepID=UPI002B261169|nr:type II CAAX endopeptidase family protein [Halorubellus sp. PRR65]
MSDDRTDRESADDAGWGDDADEWNDPASLHADDSGRDDATGGRVEAGADSSLAPWETGVGKGGFGRAFGEAVGVIVFALVVAFALALGTGFAMLLAGFEVTSTPTLIVSLTGTQTGFAVAVYAYLRWRNEPASNLGVAIPDLRGLALVAAGLIGTLALSITASVAVTLLDLQPAQNATTSQASSDPTSLLLLIPVMLLVVGPCEELLFRGVVQRRIRERASAPVAIVAGGALFASIHFIALVGDLSAIATTIGILFFPSLVFGALYEYGKNIVVNALVHGLYNSVLLALSYVAIRFAPESAQPEGAAAVLDALAIAL